MRTKNLTVYDRIYKHLFDDEQGTSLSEFDYRVKQRVQTAFIKKINHPTITDKELVSFIMTTFEVSMKTAYSDINGIEMMFGDIRKANKEYIRMIVTETQKEVINTEMERLKENSESITKWKSNPAFEKPDYYSTKDLTQAVSVLGRVNNLDKEDPNTPNWNDVQPPIIEPTDDITVMDLEAVPDTTVQKLKDRYLGKMADIQDAEIVK